jgi:4-amino-4-deoxy-L-arabinose transferase-like glycosyltransferase
VKSFLRLWVIALIVKTGLAIWLPFSNDESYYWVWGHYPQLSYFDHPPMVGWLFSLGTWLEWLGNGARLPGVWLGHLTLLIWHELLKPYLDEKRLSLWLIFVLFSPFLGAGSLIITPDVPFLFFWSLSLLAFFRALSSGKIVWYLALGASLGLGFCSKYLIVLFVPCLFIWLAWSRRWREVRWKYAPATIATGLLFCSPVIYWNWRHDWASFAFQLGHGLQSTKRETSWPIEYLLGQTALLFPPVVWFALKRRESRELNWLHVFGWFPLAFFFYTSFKARVEANWPIMAYPEILTLALVNMPDTKWVKITVGCWAVALAIVLSEIAHPWIPVEPHRLKTSEFGRFDVFLPELKRAESEHVPIYLGSYQMAATLSYKTRRQYFKLSGMNRHDFYDYLPEAKPSEDKFRVANEIDNALPAWVEKEGYEIKATKPLDARFLIWEVEKHASSAGH